MNDTPNPTPLRSILGFITKFILVIVGLFFLLLLLPMFAGSGLFDLIGALVLGWLNFLKRTLPEIRWSFDLVGMAVLCATVILFLAHSFFSWLTKTIAIACHSTWRWRWKWTWCGLVALFMLFLVGMAVGGTVHQIGWIAANPEPWMERKGGLIRILAFNDMKNLAISIQIALNEAEGNAADARREIRDPQSGVFNQGVQVPSLLQAHHILLIMGDDDKVVGYIIFPRDPQRRAQIGASYWFREIDRTPESGQVSELVLACFYVLQRKA